MSLSNILEDNNFEIYAKKVTAKDVVVENDFSANTIDATTINATDINSTTVNATDVEATNVNAELINGYPYPPSVHDGMTAIYYATTNQLVGGVIGYEGLEFQSNVLTSKYIQKASSYEFRIVENGTYEILANLFFYNGTAGGVLNINLFVNENKYYAIDYTTSTYDDITVVPPNVDKYVTYPKLYSSTYDDFTAGDVIYIGVSGTTVPQPLQFLQGISNIKITRLR